MRLIDDEAATSIHEVRNECRAAIHLRTPPVRLRADLLATGYDEKIVNECLEEYAQKYADRVANDNFTWRIIGGAVFVLAGTFALICLLALQSRIVVHGPAFALALWGLCVLCDPRWAKINGRGKFT